MTLEYVEPDVARDKPASHPPPLGLTSFYSALRVARVAMDYGQYIIRNTLKQRNFLLNVSAIKCIHQFAAHNPINVSFSHKMIISAFILILYCCRSKNKRRYHSKKHAAYISRLRKLRNKRKAAELGHRQSLVTTVARIHLVTGSIAAFAV